MKILLGTLKDKGDELASYLEPKIGVKGDVSGGAIEIEDKALKQGIRSRHVKTYVKRFLSVKKVREDYRVLVEAGELRLVELEGEEEEEEEKKSKGKKEEKAAEKTEPEESAAAASPEPAKQEAKSS